MIVYIVYNYLGRMNEKIIGFSIAIVLVFSLFKVLEMKYIDRDERALKLFIRDAVYVFLSSLAVLFVYFQFEKNIQEFFCFLTNSKNIVPNTTQIFTDDPGF